MDKNNLISIGLLFDAEEKDLERKIIEISKTIYQKFYDLFPQFNWVFNIIKRKHLPLSIPADPIDLLELSSSIKLEYDFDYILLFTEKPLKNRFNDTVNAVPSNMLEVAVISISRFQDNMDAIIGIVMHCLGHLWGLQHRENSVMKPLSFWKDEIILEWTDEEKEEIIQYLKNIADPRLEEINGKKINKFLFYIKLLLNEGFQILIEILVNKSWLLMGRLGKFTVITIISIIFLFLSAEAWEIGAHLSESWINFSIFFVITLSTLSLYLGQNLQKVAKTDKLKEQAVRSQLVIIGTILIGIISFWLSLFIISTFIIYILPQKVLLGWANLSGKLPIIHYSKIMATFGIMASALGGQLEEEDDIKAVLYYTEET